MEDDPVIVQMLINYGASMTVKSVSSGKKANTPLFLSATTGKNRPLRCCSRMESIRMIC